MLLLQNIMNTNCGVKLITCCFYINAWQIIYIATYKLPRMQTFYCKSIHLKPIRKEITSYCPIIIIKDFTINKMLTKTTQSSTLQNLMNKLQTKT
jgi:hypothetical protein